MALIVETGSGRPDAESLCSVEQANAYHAAMGNAAWAALASDAVREQLLRKATAYMRQAYGVRWQGMRAVAGQALDWPRGGVVVDHIGIAADVVPADVANACAELALRAATKTLAPDEKPMATRVKVGPIEREYSQGTSQAVRFRAVDDMVAPYLTGGRSLIRVARA